MERVSQQVRRERLASGVVTTNWRPWARALCAVLSLLILVASGVAWAMFQNFTDDIPKGEKVPALSGPDIDGDAQNILLVGIDSRAGASKAELKALHAGPDTGVLNTDTMMIMHLPKGGGTPTLISFPRDLWVGIPGYGNYKLNAAYADGYVNTKGNEIKKQGAGIRLLIQTLNGLTGLHVDHYMQVTLLGFYRISNAIGGIPVNMCTAVKEAKSGINLPKGESVIQGKQALAFVRQRHGLPQGDLDRIKRQQYFLSAAFNKVTSGGVLLNPFKLHDLMNAVGKSILIDPELDILKMARQLSDLAGGKVKTVTVPNKGTDMIDGLSVVVPDTAAIPAFVQSLGAKSSGGPGSGGTRGSDDVKAADPSKVTVTVLNGTGISRWATKNADALRKLGFTISGKPDDADSTARTVVQYPTDQLAEAKAVAKAVPGAELTVSGSVSHPTLVLGADGKRVSGVPAPGGAAGNAKPLPQVPAVNVAAKTCIN